MDGGVHWPKKLKKCLHEFINIFQIFNFFQNFLGRCTPLFIFWSAQKIQIPLFKMTIFFQIFKIKNMFLCFKQTFIHVDDFLKTCLKFVTEFYQLHDFFIFVGESPQCVYIVGSWKSYVICWYYLSTQNVQKARSILLKCWMEKNVVIWLNNII